MNYSFSMLLIFKKVFLVLISSFLFSSCFSHKYIITKSNTVSEAEEIHIRMFTLFWIIPIYNDINPDTVCPGKRIRSINMYDSAFTGFVCGITASLICPAAVGIECIK